MLSQLQEGPVHDKDFLYRRAGETGKVTRDRNKLAATIEVGWTKNK